MGKLLGYLFVVVIVFSLYFPIVEIKTPISLFSKLKVYFEKFIYNYFLYN